MDIIYLLLLSFIQGLTEFLPVSSSGHLVLLPLLSGYPDQGLDMDVVVHIGTLVAVMIYFWKDLLIMTQDSLRFVTSGFKKSAWTPSCQLVLMLVIATLPAVLVGFMLKTYALSDYLRSIPVIALSSIVFGGLMWVADRKRPYFHSTHQITFGAGLIIGIAQAIALIPGTSRSGICITAARFLGFDRTAATRFAFLLSIPAIMGAATLTTIDAVQNSVPLWTLQTFSALFFSAIFGLMAIHFMLRYVQRHPLTIFVIYRLILGGILLLVR